MITERVDVMYYTYLKAVIHVIGKRIGAQMRERIAKCLCAFCVVICLVINLLVQNTGRYEQETDIVTIESSYNRLAGGHNEAVIQLTKSEISKREALSKGTQPSGRNVVKNSSRDASGKEANLVAENAPALSLVQGVNADNGLQLEAFEHEKKYQFPVEPGHPADENYGREQNAGDFVLRDTFFTVSEDGGISADLKRAAAEEMQMNEGAPAADVWAGSADGIEDGYFKTDRNGESGEGEPEDDSEKENSGVSGNQVDEPEEPETEEAESEPEGTEPQVWADESFFTVNGVLNEDGTIFKSDITIEPVGIGGFDRIRLGGDGEFESSAIITKEAMGKTVQIYLSDGEEILNAVDFTYSKDAAAPVLGLDKDLFHVLQGEGKDIYCSNQFQLSVSCNDLEEGSGVDRLSYVYGDKTKYLLENFEEPKLSLTEDFYGKLMLGCTDRAGNVSDTSEEYILVEDDAPIVSTSEGSLCTVPYTLWVDVSDGGNIASGIALVECTVNGRKFEIENPVEYETTELYQNLEVVTGSRFPIVFEETGVYDICVKAEDNAGNVTNYETQIEVFEPELVSVLVPESFTIHIDPQQILEREQIFSDELVLQNMSEFDVRVNIDSINLKVKDGISDSGVRKDCAMYLTAPDTGEKLPLEKGINEDVYSYCLPAGAEGEITRIFFGGEVTEGSHEMWEDSDICVDVRLSFEKWEK